MKSSYNKSQLHYGDIFRTITWCKQPKRIVEFGLLEGYSLLQFAETASSSCVIEGYDIFEKFQGNSAKRTIVDKFSAFPNVKIQEGDFFTKFRELEPNSIDILHIDIAYDGHVFEFAFQFYLPLLTDTGILMLEGGSKERDDVPWMNQYNKIPIQETLQTYADVYDIICFEQYPSLTLVRKKV